MANKKYPNLSHNLSRRDINRLHDVSNNHQGPKSPFIAEVLISDEFLEINAPINKRIRPRRAGNPSLFHGHREIFKTSEGYDLLKEKREDMILNELNEKFKRIKPNVIPYRDNN